MTAENERRPGAGAATQNEVGETRSQSTHSRVFRIRAARAAARVYPLRAGDGWRAGRALGAMLALDVARAEILDRGPLDYAAAGLALDYQERDRDGRTRLPDGRAQTGDGR